MISPYAFHQFWLNCDDREVLDLLRIFTFRTKDEVEALAVEIAERPFARIAQRTLADDVTSLVHGAEEAARAVAAAKALFGDGDVRSLDAATLGAALGETPNLTIGAGPDFPTYADLLAGTGLVQSKGEARRTMAEGGAYVNNVRIEDADAVAERRRPASRGVAAASARQAEPRRRARRVLTRGATTRLLRAPRVDVRLTTS